MPDIKLNSDQRSKLQNDTSNGTANFVTGYQDIIDDISYAAQTGSALDSNSLYWYTHARLINDASSSDPSKIFIRDVVDYGLRLDGQTPVDTQIISDAIASVVIKDILSTGVVQTLPYLLGRDIRTAIDIYGLTIGGWGGSFYYWAEIPINLGGLVGQSPGAQITANLSGLNPNFDMGGEFDKFLAVNSAAAVDTAGQSVSAFLTSAATAFYGILGYGAEIPFKYSLEIAARALDVSKGAPIVGSPDVINGCEYDNGAWYQTIGSPDGLTYGLLPPQKITDASLLSDLNAERSYRLEHSSIVAGSNPDVTSVPNSGSGPQGSGSSERDTSVNDDGSYVTAVHLDSSSAGPNVEAEYYSATGVEEASYATLMPGLQSVSLFDRSGSIAASEDILTGDVRLRGTDIELIEAPKTASWNSMETRLVDGKIDYLSVVYNDRSSNTFFGDPNDLSGSWTDNIYNSTGSLIEVIGHGKGFLFSDPNNYYTSVSNSDGQRFYLDGDPSAPAPTFAADVPTNEAAVATVWNFYAANAQSDLLSGTGNLTAISMSLLSDTGSSKADRITSDDALIGRADANTTITIMNGTTILGTTVASSAGTWAYTPSDLADGSYRLTASETDISGKISTASLSFKIDTTAPAVTMTLLSDPTQSGADEITSSDAIVGIADAHATVTIMNGAAVLGTTSASSTGAWSYSPSGLVDGTYMLTASETDIAGNIGSTSITFTLDAAAPTSLRLDDALDGTSGADVLDGHGAPAGTEDYENGGGGGDTFIFGRGYGQLEIDESDYNGTSGDVLKFGPGITASRITAHSDKSGNLYLADGVSGDEIIIDRQISPSYSSGTQGVGSVEFDDGSSLSAAQLAQMASTPSAGQDGLFATSSGTVFDGKGAPAGQEDYEQGLGGGDTFVFDQGYGKLEIQEYDYNFNPNNTLQFGPGITSSTITVRYDAQQNLHITDGTAGDEVVVNSQGSGGGGGVQTVLFDDGTSLSAAQLQTLAVQGTTGADTIYGTSGNDILDGQGAPAGSQDYLNGRGGADTFLFNAGYGQLEVDESNISFWGPAPASALQFGAGITANQISITADASGNILVTDSMAGDQVKIDAMNTSGFVQRGVSNISFADGTSWTRSQILFMAANGTTGADTISASTTGAVFNGKGAPAGFQDVESGKGGGDTFIFNAGYGQLEIDEQDLSSDGNNVLQFGSGITASTITVTTDGSNNLIIADGVTGDLIKIDRELDSGRSGGKIQTVHFVDGTTLSRAQLIARSGPAEVDPSVYVFSKDSGPTTIDPNGTITTIQFGAGISASDLTFQADSAGDLTILVDGDPANSLTISGDLYYQSGVHSQVNQLSFADGTSMTLDDDITSTWTGTATNTVLTGSFWGSNTYVLAAGGDQVTFGNGIPASSQNTVLFGRGDGGATIDPNSVSGTIQFGAGISASDLTFQADDVGDLTILVDGDPANPLTISRDLYYSYDGYAGVRSQVQLSFADGTSMALGDNITSTWTGTATNMVLTGSGWSANTFVLGAGGDQVTFGNGDLGGSSQNTVLFGRGDGGATINPNRASGTIQFGAGISASDLTFQADDAGDLTILVDGDPANSLTISNDLYNNSGVYSQVQLSFADGTSMAPGTNITSTWAGTATSTALTGTGWGPNMFVLGTGGDQVTFGNGNRGGLPRNTVLFERADGGATIDPNGANGTIQFGAGISASDLTFQADSAGDLTILVDGDPANSLTISGDLYYQSGVHSQVNQLSFADGTSMTLDDDITSTWTGTTTNTVLTGSFWGSNTFVLGAGGDQVTFGNGIPTSSQNTVLFGRDDGGATIDPNSVNGTIQLSADISASDLTFQADDAGDLTILVDGDPANSLTISRDLYYSYNGYEGVHSQVQLSFADGTSKALGDDITSTWTGTAANTVLTGSGWSANTFVLGAGGDQVTFGNGDLGGSSQNTVLFGRGDGGATIDPNRASGTVQFTEDFTTSSLWLSHSGNDLVISAFGSADTLDIKDWFSANPQSWSVVAANGFTVDSQLGQLIDAMNTYAQNTPGFDPTKATAMPTDSQLQSALTAAWHT